MKGYYDNTAKVLYVFPQTADAIPYVDPEAEAIAIQPEQLNDFQLVNSEYADIMVAYNYSVMTIKPKVWKDHLDDDIVSPTPEPQDPELAWSADSATVTIGADDNVFPTLANPHSVTVSYSSSDNEKATIDASTGEITLVAAGNTTISAVFAGNEEYAASTVSYTLTVEAAPAPNPEEPQL